MYLLLTPVQSTKTLKAFSSIQETRLCNALEMCISLSSSIMFFLIQKQQKLDSACGSGFWKYELASQALLQKLTSVITGWDLLLS